MPTSTIKNKIYQTLSKIDVSPYVEKKLGLDYVSWAHAWSILKAHYPESHYKIYENNGWPCFTDGKTFMVHVEVTVVDGEYSQTYEEYLAVMNAKNQSVQAGDINSTHIITSIQRALTKAIARHGLGLNVYAGEDLPIGEKIDFTNLYNEIEAALKKKTVNWDKDKKNAFVNDVIIPTIGQVNYKACTNSSALSSLLEKVNKLDS